MVVKLLKVDGNPSITSDPYNVLVVTSEFYNDMKEYLKSGRTIKEFEPTIYYNEDGDWSLSFSVKFDYHK